MTEVAYGAFPFGRPNTIRALRRPSGPARALVVGVYPSAFHVAWSPPPRLDPREESARRRPYIGSLAVDVEPTVFWDGVEPAPVELLGVWKRHVNFGEETHGTVSLGNNGPSGALLRRDILEPLGLLPSDTAFTDVVPWFFVKSGREGQGDAILNRFGPIASQLHLHRGSLPARPTPRGVVDLAASPLRRDSLRAEIAETRAPLVITLGQEALDSVRAVSDGCDGVPSRLQPAGYGQRGELTIDGGLFALLPLAHPGFQRQTSNPEWTGAFARWRDLATETRR